MIDSQLRFKRAASVRNAPGSEPSHVHIVRPSRRHAEARPELSADTLRELTDVQTLDSVEEAA